MQLVPDNIDFSAYMDEPEQHNVRPASDWLDETIASFFPTSATPKAPGMLWQKTSGKVAFRQGEVSLWAGVNGHGKSTFLSQVELDLCYQAERVMSASFEMRPVKQMHRMSRQSWAGRDPSMQFLRDFHKWTDGRLWMYDHHGAVDWRKLLAVLRYAVKEFGITQFVIDSLMKCVKGEDDYNAQKDFVDQLCAFASSSGTHVHLVHHVRKGESEHKAPGKFDIKGAGAITDLVDNVFIVWRNKKSEQENVDNRNRDEPDCDIPTCFLDCAKQRNGEFEGKFGFWFDPASQQYLEVQSQVAQRYAINTTAPLFGSAA